MIAESNSIAAPPGQVAPSAAIQTSDLRALPSSSVMLVAMPTFTPLVANGGRQNDDVTGFPRLMAWFVLRLLLLPLHAPSSYPPALSVSFDPSPASS